MISVDDTLPKKRKVTSVIEVEETSARNALNPAANILLCVHEVLQVSNLVFTKITIVIFYY